MVSFVLDASNDQVAAMIEYLEENNSSLGEKEKEQLNDLHSKTKGEDTKWTLIRLELMSIILLVLFVCIEIFSYYCMAYL